MRVLSKHEVELPRMKVTGFGVYFEVQLSYGMAPKDMKEKFSQRMKWTIRRRACRVGIKIKTINENIFVVVVFLKH